MHSETALTIPRRTIYASMIEPVGARLRPAAHLDELFVVLQHSTADANLVKNWLVSAAGCFHMGVELEFYKILPNAKTRH